MPRKNPPFTRMVAGFGLQAAKARKHRRKFRQMSAGFNNIPPSEVIREVLKLELDTDLTTRNYGRAVGVHPITSVIELVENAEAGATGLKVALSNGATESARKILEMLSAAGVISRGDSVLMLGHGFPLYAGLSDLFQFKFHECLAEPGGPEWLPSVSRVEATMESVQPRVVYLLLPNNPIGQQFTPAEIARIVAKARALGATLLVDRVCTLPWDDTAPTMRVLAPSIRDGACFVVDSISKSESLAGLRCGFAIMNEDWLERIAQLNRLSILNPPVFPAITLAFCRLAEADPALTRHARRLIVPQLEYIFSEYPSTEALWPVFDQFAEYRARYVEQLAAKQARLQANFAVLQGGISDLADRPLTFESSFNVAVSLRTMHRKAEQLDQYELADKHGLGVLPESCFRVTPNRSRRYFLRIGLTLSEQDFADGISRLAAFYQRRAA